MRSLLFRNLGLTLPTALAFTVLGYLFSLPMGFLFDSYAAWWQVPGSFRPSIETQRLDQLNQFRARVTLAGTATGIAIAQSTFIVHALKPSSDEDSN
ncbi:hypothetical protein [Pseudanabaena sp. FACHB-2040]|uniref:hypothetical protein n=1 Tax=Pseudanabaena sp. FACHB-2040 TaxID=2692859 RepID=UPI001686E9EB|nr:hypothetical protein [Pseudanabaena sp. FACHB-2040]MBD2256187.1 hypothetical protein [Pseudanabaena sp. FACHB-2040]